MDCDVRYKYMHTSDEWNGGEGRMGLLHTLAHTRDISNIIGSKKRENHYEI